MPRAKKTTAKDTKTVAKKKVTTKKVVQPVIDIEAIKEELREEMLQQIEIMIPQESDAFVDMDLLREEIKKEVEFTAKRQKEQAQKAAEIFQTKSEIILQAENSYSMVSDIDGFGIRLKDKNYMSINKSGAIGFGLKSPRGVGLGSVHLRANYTSEAPLPTHGPGSTRGLIVEGDGDDNGSFSLRVVSRANKQGLNVTSDGKLRLGLIDDATESRLSVLQSDNESNAVNVSVPSKIYNETFINLNASSTASDKFKFISAKAEEGSIEVFNVNGNGDIQTETGLYSNSTGYGELFQWADENTKDENRVGFTVALNENGKLVLASDGDKVIGVVAHSAAVIGNAGWNTWTQKYYNTEDEHSTTVDFKVVEWIDELGTLQSHYLDSLGANFALPDGSIIYKTYYDGSTMKRRVFSDEYDMNKEYIPRINRGYTIVILTGRVSMFKGQEVNSTWTKLYDINDNLECWIL
jgi:hypothetical protein